jgi:hypothetical protein
MKRYQPFGKEIMIGHQCHSSLTLVILSVSEESRAQRVRFFADAQNDKQMLFIPSAFSSTFAAILDKYVGINHPCGHPRRFYDVITHSTR